MTNIEAIKARQSAAKAEFTDGQYDQATRDIDTLLALARDQQAKLDRVEALADEWFRELENPEHMIHLEDALDAIRAAITATEAGK